MSSTNYPLLDAFLTMLWFFLWILWLFLLFRVVADIFRDDALRGWGKAGWLIFVIVLPYLGVLVYLIARGSGMGNRDVKAAKEQKAALDAYIREAATGGGDPASASEMAPAQAGHADQDNQLAKLHDLRSSGVLTEVEFQQAKARIMQ